MINTLVQVTIFGGGPLMMINGDLFLFAFPPTEAEDKINDIMNKFNAINGFVHVRHPSFKYESRIEIIYIFDFIDEATAILGKDKIKQIFDETINNSPEIKQYATNNNIEFTYEVVSQ